MTEKKQTFWVVFWRGHRCRNWRPQSVHLTHAAANSAYWKQINDGPPGGHRMHKFDTPVTSSRG